MARPDEGPRETPSGRKAEMSSHLIAFLPESLPVQRCAASTCPKSNEINNRRARVAEHCAGVSRRLPEVGQEGIVAQWMEVTQDGPAKATANGHWRDRGNHTRHVCASMPTLHTALQSGV